LHCIAAGLYRQYQCKVQITRDFGFLESIIKCRLHKSLRGQAHLDGVLAQNRRFNLSLGRELTETQTEKIDLAKEVNVLRITKEDLTNFNEHLPHEFPGLTFFQNLRRILRI